MRINNNITAMNTHRQYSINTSSVAKSTEKLSSGYRINRAGDDAAGLAISEKMRAQIRGLTMASKNSSDAVSLIQTAEGALQSTHNVLQRMRELAVQSASDTNEQTIDRAALEQEFQALVAEINDTAAKTRFNDQNLIDGTFAGDRKAGSASMAGVSVYLANNAQANTYTVSVKQVSTGYALGTAPSVGSAFNTNGLAAGSGALDLANDIQKSSLMNGTYIFEKNSNTGLLQAKNTDTGKVHAITITTNTDITGGAGNVVFDIDGIGEYTYTTAANEDFAFDANPTGARDGFTDLLDGSSFDLAGGVTYDPGETKFYATMTGANDVELKVGMTHVTFDNGITLKLPAGLTQADLTKQVQADANGQDMPNDAAYVADATLAANLRGNVEVKVAKNAPLIIQTGANEGDELGINVDRMDAIALGIGFSSVRTRESASHAITEVNNAINMVSTQRAALGALQNRLDYKIANLDTSAENLSAAESRIRDLDMAKEMTNFTRNNILVQASTAMLAQANAAPQGVLQLLG